MDTAPITPNPKLRCLKGHIVNFLVYRLKNDLITQKRAAQLAQSVLDQLAPTLTNEQIFQTLESFKTTYPELNAEIESARAACETQAAREAIDHQVLEQVTQGNVETALQLLDQFKVK